VPNAVLALVMASPGAIWGCIQIYNYYLGPKTNAPDTLNAIAFSEDPADDERILVKFDMARSMWPGTLEYKISAALRDAPPNSQMLFLMFPEYFSERAQKRHDLLSGIAGLILSLALTPFFMIGMAIWNDGVSTKGIFIVSALVLAFLSIPTTMFRYALRQKRLSRSAEKLAELKEENGLRLAFEWTAPKSQLENSRALLK
jgi:hypothetical protein